MSDNTPAVPTPPPAPAAAPKPAALPPPRPLIREDPSEILVTSTSPHIHDGSSVHKIMRDVVISLLPCTLAAIGFFGWRAALLVAVCVGSWPMEYQASV